MSVISTLYQPFPLPGVARGHIWHHAPQTRRPRHFHLEPELNLVVAGSGAFGMGEMVIPVGPGDLLWWPPGQDHELLDSSPNFDLYVIGLAPGLAERCWGASNGAAYQGPTRLRLSPEQVLRLRQVCSAPLEGRDRTAVERHVGDVWRDLHGLRVRDTDNHPLTRRTLGALLAQPTLTREELARHAHCCPSEVSRCFHRDRGMTLLDYRTRLRLLHFIKGVDEGASFLDAALEAGFGSYSQCHRAFGRILGCGPRAFFASDLRTRMAEVFSPASGAVDFPAERGPKE